jgi:hypothetical protein
MRHIGSKSKKFLWAATSIAAVTVAVAVTVALAASRTAVAAAPAAPAAPACTASTPVQTEDGPVCGLLANGATSYLGIPYASTFAVFDGWTGAGRRLGRDCGADGLSA